jgi:signal transduction histidine kinase
MEDRQRGGAVGGPRSLGFEVAAADLLDGVPVPTVVFGPDGRIEAVNLAAVASLGRFVALEAPDAPAWLRIEGACDAVGHRPVPESAWPPACAAARGEPVDLDVSVAPERELRVSARPLRFRSGALGAIATFFDLTCERRLVRELEDSIASAVHDLRSSVTSLTGYMAALERLGRENEAAGEARRILLAAMRAAARLRSRAELLLDAAAIRAGVFALTRASVDLAALASMTVEALRDESPAHELRFEPPPVAASVEGDAARLALVIENVVRNAIRYSPQGGPVTVRLSVGPAEVELSVTDKGLGIEPDEMPLLFRRYGRACRTGSVARGCGLGLYLAREIVERHGGRIFAESDGAGRGSTFHIVLPRAPGPAAEPSSSSPAAT